MSEHEMEPKERSELAERLVWLGKQNQTAVEVMRAGGRPLSPVDVLDLRLGTMLDLAFGPIPRATSAEDLAEHITDARLVFEAEWQDRLAALLERANKPTIAVPNATGKIHLP